MDWERIGNWVTIIVFVIAMSFIGHLHGLY